MRHGSNLAQRDHPRSLAAREPEELFMTTQTESRGQNGQEQSEPTRGQIREDQDRFARLQERYQEQAHEQADEVKQQLQRANETGREAVGQYVRGLTRR